MQTLSIEPKRPAAEPSAPPASPASPARRWWHEPWMWLVVGGPAAVVLAGLVTAFLAASAPDRLVESDYYRRGVEINRTLEPALRARNAATADAAAGVPAARAAQAAAAHRADAH